MILHDAILNLLETADRPLTFADFEPLGSSASRRRRMLALMVSQGKVEREHYDVEPCPTCGAGGGVGYLYRLGPNAIASRILLREDAHGPEDRDD